MDKLLCYLRMVKIPQLLKKDIIEQGSLRFFARSWVFVKPKPKFLSNYSPYSKVLILSSALQKSRTLHKTEENRANKYLTDLKCLRETQDNDLALNILDRTTRLGRPALNLVGQTYGLWAILLVGRISVLPPAAVLMSQYATKIVGDPKNFANA